MKGMSEAYATNSRPQGNVANELFGRIEQHVLPHLVLDREKLFTILEYGAGPGTSSEFVLKPLLQAIQQKQTDQSVMVYMEDLPSNPWHQVFENVPAKLSDLNSEHIHLAGIGKSFYESLLPPASVDLVYSTTAMHWLPSEQFNNLPVSFRHRQIFVSAENVNEEDHQIAEQFARTCWAKCFRHRARELKSGGYLALAMPRDRKLSDKSPGFEFSHVFPYDSVPAELHDKMTCAVWGLSSATVDLFFRSPGEDNEFDMSDLYEVLHSEEHLLGCPFTRLFPENKDIEAKGRVIYDAFLAVVGPYVRSVLSTKMSDAEVDAVFSQWAVNWATYVQKLDDTHALMLELPSAIVILKRK